MGFSQKLASQLAHPRGMGGQWLGKAMDIANRKLTNLAVEMLAPQPGEAILDAGCGTGAALHRAGKAANCHLFGIEPSAQMRSAAHRLLGGAANLRSGLIESRPFADESFDGMLALNVLYFADDDGGMTSALHAMLRPGGRLVIYVTARETMERWRFIQAGYHRLYDEEELANALVAGGFACDQIEIRRQTVGAGTVGLFAYAIR